MTSRTITVAFLLTASVQSAVAQQERRCLALHGAISYGAIGRAADGRGMHGDTLLVGFRAIEGKEISVGVYLFYRNTAMTLEGKTEGFGEWQGVPVINEAIDYRSMSLNSAGTSIRWRSTPLKTALATAHFFIPYEVLALPRGTYEVVYRVRAWANGELIDDFLTDTARIVESTGSTWYENQYKCFAPDNGPVICGFRLLGTADPPDETVDEEGVYGREPVIAE